MAQGEGDPHDWNSYDHYQTIHEIRIEQHPFVDHERPNTVIFDETEADDLITQRGQVYCLCGAILEVEKRLRVSYSGGQRRVRTFSYRYVGWIENTGPVLRYHNLHEDPDEYHHRVLDPYTEDTLFYETLHRHQFPTFSEVLDELEVITRSLDA
jgi:hypothetical protein